jgi:hypothetical protein
MVIITAQDARINKDASAGLIRGRFTNILRIVYAAAPAIRIATESMVMATTMYTGRQLRCNQEIFRIFGGWRYVRGLVLRPLRAVAIIENVLASYDVN